MLNDLNSPVDCKPNLLSNLWKIFTVVCWKCLLASKLDIQKQNILLYCFRSSVSEIITLFTLDQNSNIKSIYTSVTRLLFRLFVFVFAFKELHLFSKDTFNWLNVTVNTFLMLQKISISYTHSYFELEKNVYEMPYEQNIWTLRIAENSSLPSKEYIYILKHLSKCMVLGQN